MKRLLLFMGCCSVSFLVFAGGDDDYAVSKIPANLIENANAVTRNEVRRFEINANNRATYSWKVAYTVLNEQGDPWGSFAAYYDKLSSIESFEGSLYDAAGKKIKSLKKGDIKDVNSSDENNFLDDNRVKWHSFFYKVYPYTVEYEVVTSYRGTMFLPRWIPQMKNVMSVQRSLLTVITPASGFCTQQLLSFNSP